MEFQEGCVLDQQCQRAVKDSGDVAVGICVSQQVARAKEFVVSCARDGDLELVVVC